MSLFRIVANIGINSSELEAGLKRAQSVATSAMNAIGDRVKQAFTAAAIEEFIKKVARAAGEIGDLSDQLSITTDEVQQLQKAADRSGVSFDRYATALNRVRKLKSDFASGDPAAQRTFSKTGLDPNASEMDLLRGVGKLSDSQVFEILGEKAYRLKNSLSELNNLSPIELIRKEDIDAIKSATDGLGDILRVVTAITSKLMGPEAARFGLLLAMIRRKIGSEDGVAPTPQASSMPDGFSIAGRDSGSMAGPDEFFGPTRDEAMMQLYTRQARRRNASFSPVPVGDRANIGGFFGPNADVNNRMASELTKISKGIEAIDAKLLQALTNP